MKFSHLIKSNMIFNSYKNAKIITRPFKYFLLPHLFSFEKYKKNELKRGIKKK